MEKLRLRPSIKCLVTQILGVEHGAKALYDSANALPYFALISYDLCLFVFYFGAQELLPAMRSEIASGP